MSTPQVTPYAGFAKKYDRDFDLRGGHSILVGPEYDKGLRVRLESAMLEKGATRGRTFDGMYAAEGITLAEWRLDGRLMTIETQGYIGMKLSGRMEDITAIVESMAKPVKANQSS